MNALAWQLRDLPKILQVASSSETKLYRKLKPSLARVSLKKVKPVSHFLKFQYFIITVYTFLTLANLAVLQAQTPVPPKRDMRPTPPLPRPSRETFESQQNSTRQRSSPSNSNFSSNPFETDTNRSSPESDANTENNFDTANHNNAAANNGTVQINSIAEEQLESSAPIPPYPNYPESTVPRPPRSPRQQEYLYFNHFYLDGTTAIIGGFLSFGWFRMTNSGKALRIGLDIYIPQSNLNVSIEGNQDNPNYAVTGLQIRFGAHFFANRTQLKGFSVGFDTRSGIIIAPASGSAVLVQVGLELPISYRFVVSFYSNSGRQAASFGIAPYIAIGISTILSTSSSVSLLRSNDPGLEAYLTNGRYFLEPNYINEIGPLSVRLSFRLGIDLSVVF